MKAGRLVGLLTAVLGCGSNSSASCPACVSSDASHDSATSGPEGSADTVPAVGDVGITDAAAGDSDAADAIPTCSGFSSPQVQCSSTCYGRCAGLNDANVADPSNHIGNCYFTAPGNIVFYCVQWDAADPCTLCP